jgi:hypothetical protein
MGSADGTLPKAHCVKAGNWRLPSPCRIGVCLRHTVIRAFAPLLVRPSTEVSRSRKSDPHFIFDFLEQLPLL